MTENDSAMMNDETNREVTKLLMTVAGERGDNEGAVKVVKRLIKESRTDNCPDPDHIPTDAKSA